MELYIASAITGFVLILLVRFVLIRVKVNKKINKLGIAFAVANAVIVITIAYLDSLGSSRGFGLVAILAIDMPVSFVIMFFTKLIPFSSFIIIPIFASILGGLQWYCIGWLISGVASKIKEQFK